MKLGYRTCSGLGSHNMVLDGVHFLEESRINFVKRILRGSCRYTVGVLSALAFHIGVTFWGRLGVRQWLPHWRSRRHYRRRRRGTKLSDCVEIDVSECIRFIIEVVFIRITLGS